MDCSHGIHRTDVWRYITLFNKVVYNSDKLQYNFLIFYNLTKIEKTTTHSVNLGHRYYNTSLRCAVCFCYDL